MSSIPATLQSERFERLMNQSYKKVYNVAYRLCMDRQDAEDLTQDAFVRAHRSFESYEGHRPFENWILRIVTRLFLDMKRVRSRRPVIVPPPQATPLESTGTWTYYDQADPAKNAEQLIFDQTMSEQLQAAMKGLKPAELAIIVMAEIDQMEHRDISEALGVPMSTVRSRLHRARRSLRKGLQTDAAPEATPAPQIRLRPLSA